MPTASRYTTSITEKGCPRVQRGSSTFGKRSKVVFLHIAKVVARGRGVGWEVGRSSYPRTLRG